MGAPPTIRIVGWCDSINCRSCRRRRWWMCSGGRSLPLERVLMWLSLAGLNEAFVMLRRPCELSDGQRYRLRLAQVMAMLNESPAASAVVIADEFGSTLDRITALTIARNLKRWLAKHATDAGEFRVRDNAR